MVRALLGALFLALFIVGPARAQDVPTGECAPGHFLSAATVNVTQLAVGRKALCGALVITNLGSTTGGDLRIFDTNAMSKDQCSGSYGLKWNVPIPVNSTATNIAGIVIPLPQDVNFRNGIGVCLTGAVSDTDVTNFVTGVQVNFGIRG